VTKPDDRNGGKPTWRVRRRIIHTTLIYCAFCVLWVLMMEKPTSVHETIAVSLVGLAISVISSYIFGAVWDDHNQKGGG